MFTNFTHDFVLVKYIAKLICFSITYFFYFTVYKIIEMSLNYYVLLVFGISPFGFLADLHGCI